MPIWVDVTTSLNWNRPPVGIVRTELECAKAAMERAFSEPTDLCYYDGAENEFRRLSPFQRQKIVDLLSGKFNSQLHASLPNVFWLDEARQAPTKQKVFFRQSIRYSLDPIETGCVRGWALRGRGASKASIVIKQGDQILAEVVANDYREDLAKSGLGDGHCAFSIPLSTLIERIDPKAQSRLEVFVANNRQVQQNIGAIGFDADAVRRLRKSPPEVGQVVKFGADDVYISAGLDWDNKDFSKIFSLKLERKFKVVGFCYDLIPFYFPQLCVGDVSSFFSKYFSELSWSADGIICISKCSEADFIKFTSLSGCPTPETRVVRLGSTIASSDHRYSPSDNQLASLLQSEYILYVSTIERRKNHETLYRAYVRLLEKGVPRLPKLVFVGMNGWGVADALNDIRLDPRIQDRILLLNNVGDDDLSHLYDNCMFTVFPSLYEGWGLPVAESLAHGKFCLASGTGSIPEIAGDLLDYIDPWDVPAWADAIEGIVSDQHNLKARELRIKNEFRPDEWRACVRDVFEFATSRLNS